MLLYETLSQPLTFLVILCIGLASGLLFDLRNYVNFLFAKNKTVSIILDIVTSLIICGILFISNLYFNYGEFRFYIILAFLLELLIQLLTLEIIVAKICTWCYNKIRKLVSKIYERRAKKKESIINS